MAIQVTRDEAVDLFRAMGFARVERWTTDKLLTRLRKIKFLSFSGELTPMQQRLYDRICEGVAEGDYVELIEAPVVDESTESDEAVVRPAEAAPKPEAECKTEAAEVAAECKEEPKRKGRRGRPIGVASRFGVVAEVLKRLAANGEVVYEDLLDEADRAARKPNKVQTGYALKGVLVAFERVGLVDWDRESGKILWLG